MKSEFGNESRSNYSKNVNILNEDLQSEKSRQRNSHKSPDALKVIPEKELLKKI